MVTSILNRVEKEIKNEAEREMVQDIVLSRLVAVRDSSLCIPFTMLEENRVSSTAMLMFGMLNVLVDSSKKLVITNRGLAVIFGRVTWLQIYNVLQELKHEGYISTRVVGIKGKGTLKQATEITIV